MCVWHFVGSGTHALHFVAGVDSTTKLHNMHRQLNIFQKVVGHLHDESAKQPDRQQRRIIRSSK